MSYRVLIVAKDADSDPAMLQELGKEFVVGTCTLAARSLDLMREETPDLILLDPDLPDMPGTTFLQVIRESASRKETGVIVTSSRHDKESVLKAFAQGADDFLAKPFDVRELVVRIRAVLRRRFERIAHFGAPLSIAGVEIVPSDRGCSVDGRRVVLRPMEFALLEILMRKAGRVLTRAYLLETVWGMSMSASTRAVDVMVSRLRRGLGPKAGKRIETVSKLGYTFRPS